jgi:hypothetical protein
MTILHEFSAAPYMLIMRLTKFVVMTSAPRAVHQLTKFDMCTRRPAVI